MTMSTWERSPDPDIETWHPNRDDPAVQFTRAAIILLLLASIVLLVVITIGGWDALAGMKLVQILYILVYVLMLVQAIRWSRGSLPVDAALAVILAILAAVSVSTWFDRNSAAFTSPGLSETTIGTLVAILIPVQLLIVLVAFRGFSQGWNVEEERPARRNFDGPRARTA
jgi:hypothetical protein